MTCTSLLWVFVAFRQRQVHLTHLHTGSVGKGNVEEQVRQGAACFLCFDMKAAHLCAQPVKTQPCAFFIFIFIAPRLWKHEGEKPTNVWDGADEGPHCSAVASLSSRQQAQCEAVSFLSPTLPLIYFFLSGAVADFFFFFSFNRLPPEAARAPSHLSLPFIFILCFCLASWSQAGQRGRGSEDEGAALCRTLPQFVAPLCCVSEAHPLPLLLLLPPCCGGVGGVGEGWGGGGPVYFGAGVCIWTTVHTGPGEPSRLRASNLNAASFTLPPCDSLLLNKVLR